MKKACVYILLSFFLLNNSLGELFKIPVLYAHFMEHRHLDSRIDLLDFLSMHYLGNDLNDNDQDRDMQLPFKKIDGHGSFQIVISPVSKPSFEKRAFFPVEKLSLPNAQDFNLKDPSLDCLFRPPIA